MMNTELFSSLGFAERPAKGLLVNDLNEWPWVIEKEEGSIILSFCGDDQFTPVMLILDDNVVMKIKGNKDYRIGVLSDNCVAEIIEMIAENYTDDIWDNLGELYVAKHLNEEKDAWGNWVIHMEKEESEMD
jgi:hypothetical protein